MLLLRYTAVLLRTAVLQVGFETVRLLLLLYPRVVRVELALFALAEHDLNMIPGIIVLLGVVCRVWCVGAMSIPCGVGLWSI